MLKYFVLTLALVTVRSLMLQSEQRIIKEIKEGPYQNYSGEPLVDLGGKFYYFEVTVATTWDEAKIFCRNLDFNLVSIEDETENELIKEYILTSLGPRHYWTSGSDSVQEGQWTWTSTARPVVFTDWHSGEPNNLNGNEDVIVMWHKNGVLAWNDWPETAAPVYACCEQDG
ncbi:hypothetical protein B566_EDAN007866 [Ephemera danica]|nr:hypothetical protein B566_EDAN007866 [Ephemera danica]